MAEVKEVFISYHEASAGELVRKLADRLEGAGMSCWYSRRDMPSGGSFADYIPERIKECKVFLLVLNAGTSVSLHIKNEMTLAFRRLNNGEDITIIPYQVEECEIAPWLADYYLLQLQVERAGRMDMGALATEIAHKLGREPVKHGNCGHGTKWKFQDGVLTISKRKYAKEGTMGDFYVQSVPECSNTPWWSDRERIKSVVIENGVTNIGGKAFRDCSGLTSVRFPDSLASIGDGAFFRCSGLASVRFPDSLASIGDWAFCGCSGLASVRFPDSLASIGFMAFFGCSGLASVHFPDSLSSIGNGAFYNCPNLKSVSVPENAEIDYAFDDTTEVTRRPAR